MRVDAELLARPNATRRLFSRCAAPAGPLTTTVGCKRDEVEAEKVFECDLEFIYFLAQLEFEIRLRFGVEIARFHARVEIERFAIDGHQVVRGSNAALVFAVAREREEAGVDFVQ